MKKNLNAMLAALAFVPCTALAQQGWQDNYQGVMLQGFSWDSYVDTQWSNLESQSDELSKYFSLIWVPQSGNCNSSWNVMGYTPVYYFDQNSSFGTEAQLRSMISTFKAKGTGIIADVVVNHRNNLGVNGSWVDYPVETYKGKTYQMTSTDITSNDDGGATKTWADANGYTLGNTDEGEDWSGCRDLDHKSTNVQTIIKAYEDFLLNDLGYTGFRYDMVNLLGSNQYLVNNNYNNGSYRRYAVTFVENHDMQDRGTTSGYSPDPILKDTLAANAFMMAMPGTPCVFLPHWKAYKADIKSMINARKIAGISNTSSYINMRSSASLYAVATEGNNAHLLAAVGNGVSDYEPSSTYVKILSGYHYAYYLNKEAETAWVATPSGTYTNAFQVTLQAVSNDANAKLVYTTDGSTPTASSKQVSDGTKLTISSNETLTVGLLTNGTVKGIVSREYVIKSFEPHTATVYLKDPSWSDVYFYAWDNTSSHSTLLGSWPGTKMTATKSIDGYNWYYHTFDVNAADYSFNIIFDQGNGKDQTVDIGPITEDKYYEIAAKSNGKYTVNDLTSTVTGISDVTYTKPATATGWYTLQGVRINKPVQHGIYIHNGRKVIVK